MAEVSENTSAIRWYDLLICIVVLVAVIITQQLKIEKLEAKVKALNAKITASQPNKP